MKITVDRNGEESRFNLEIRREMLRNNLSTIQLYIPDRVQGWHSNITKMSGCVLVFAHVLIFVHMLVSTSSFQVTKALWSVLEVRKDKREV